MIKVIDSIMGRGKTNYAIQMMQESTDRRFIYITPYLDEINERILKYCPNFEQPLEVNENGETILKRDSLHELLKQGKNIVSTHQLFKLSTDYTIELLKCWEYTLIIDEVMELVDHKGINKEDFNVAIKANLCHIDDEGYLIWDDENYKAGNNYKELKTLCKNKSIFVVNNQALVWVFPPRIFNYFKETFVLTYLFEAQIMKYYFELYDIKYKKMRVIETTPKRYTLIDHDDKPDNTSCFKGLIDICERGRINDIGSKETDKRKNAEFRLSRTWYNERANEEDFTQLRNNIDNFFRHYCKTPVELNVWTTFVAYEEQLKGRRYPDFLECNARATNNYRHKTSIAYTINRFMHRSVEQFFQSKEITIDKKLENQYALSELLQFIFRSAIRDGLSIKIYLPSIRMRNLLKGWLGIPKGI